jgi:CBS domain containing-hemolysin-like protein
MYKTDPEGAKKLDDVKGDIDTAVSAILTLNTVAHTMGAAGVGAQAMVVFGSEVQTLVSVLLTLAVLYFSEIIPKTIGATYWQSLAVPSAKIINILIKITYPLLIISKQITKRIKPKKMATISRDEILAVAELGEKSGTIGEIEGDLIENILSLKSMDTYEILTPRSVVFALDQNMTIHDAITQEDIHAYTRVPLYEGSIDNITGFMLSDDILKNAVEENYDKALKEFQKPIFHISENLPVLHLLNLFLKRKEQIFVVHDSFSQTVGVVSLEDAIETLVGMEIVDEVDKVANLRELAKQKAKLLREQNCKTKE